MSDVRIEHGDMREVLARMVADGVTVQSIVTDPPYHLTSIVKRFGAENAAPAKIGKTGAYARASTGFMGKVWDGGDIAFKPETWRLCYDLLPPGGHLLAFSGTRTYHRMACAIEDAGFEIRDMVSWLYGSGFPKSHNVAKGIDRAAGAAGEVIGTKRAGIGRNARRGGELVGGEHDEAAKAVNVTAPATDAARQWEGWGTALKPALEPICLARKPRAGTVASNVLAYGTGALNIDGCRVGDFKNTTPPGTDRYNKANFEQGYRPNAYGRDGEASVNRRYTEKGSTGRWPANVALSWPEDEYALRPDVTAAEKADLYGWLSENT